MTTRRTALAAMTAACFAFPALALGPNDTIRIIVPYSPGGGYDTQARQLAPRLEQALRESGLGGVAVIVENITGGGGAVGTAAAYVARADGTTLLMMDPESSIYHELLSDAPFVVGNFSYIAQHSADPLVFAVRRDLGITSFEEAVARSQDVPLLMGASGGTGYGLVFPVMMRRMLEEAGTAFEMDYVPMSGTSEVVASMRRGEVEATVRSEVAMFQAYHDEVVDILFSFAEESPYLMCEGADGASVPCPSASETLGLPDEDFALLSSAARYRRVYVGPPGMEEETLETLRAAFDQILTDPAFVEASAASNNPVLYLPGDVVLSEIQRELALADRYADYLRETIQ